MAENAPLTPSEQDLMRDIAQFASRKTETGVYINQMYSASLGTPVLLIVALGEQAMALRDIVMGAVERPKFSSIIEIDNGKPGW